MLYDVIVVGAGPAGAVLAHQIASQGHQVLVLEKANALL
jgi:flavin-dependent dehydrogenase